MTMPSTAELGYQFQPTISATDRLKFGEGADDLWEAGYDAAIAIGYIPDADPGASDDWTRIRGELLIAIVAEFAAPVAMVDADVPLGEEEPPPNRVDDIAKPAGDGEEIDDLLDTGRHAVGCIIFIKCIAAMNGMMESMLWSDIKRALISLARHMMPEGMVDVAD